MRWLRHPVGGLIAELAILAIPLNAAYGFAMGIVYRLDAVWGALFAIAAAVAACNAYNLYARFVARRDADELAPRGIRGLGYGLGLGASLIAFVVAMLAVKAGATFLQSQSGLAFNWATPAR